MEHTSNINYFTQFTQEMSLDTKIGLNLENEIDFSGNPVKTCVLMTQPEYVINQSISSKLGDKSISSKLQFWKFGKTLFLNHKNNELCNQMHPKKVEFISTLSSKIL